MSDTHTYKTITVSSRHLQNNTFYLPRAINVKGVRVESLFFPHTFRNVGPQNNKVYIRQRFLVGETNVEVPGSVTISNGSYTAQQFVTQLQNSLNNSGVGGWAGTWTVTLNETTYRLTIANDTRDFIVEAGPDSLNELMGFTVLSTVYGQNKVGNNVVKLVQTKVVNLQSNLLGNMLEDNFYSYNMQDNSILATVYVNGSFGDYIEHRPINHLFYTLGRGQQFQLTQIDLTLTDEAMRPLDLQGAEWFVTLSFL